MSSPVSDETSPGSRQKRLTGHLEAALEEADDENLRFHIRQALQFAAKRENAKSAE